jgi:hypothetical protein
MKVNRRRPLAVLGGEMARVSFGDAVETLVLRLAPSVHIRIGYASAAFDTKSRAWRSQRPSAVLIWGALGTTIIVHVSDSQLRVSNYVQPAISRSCFFRFDEYGAEAPWIGGFVKLWHKADGIGNRGGGRARREVTRQAT